MEKLKYATKIVIPSFASDVLQVVFGVTTLFLSAFVYFYMPGNPVPITLQVFSVLMIASLFNKTNSVIAIFSYILLGVFGLPIFAGATGGLSHLFGPTGGYITGFIVAAYIIPYLRKYIGLLFSLFIGLLSIYLLGWIQLSLFLHFNFARAFSLGVLPFIIYDIIKLITVYFLVKGKRGF